MISVTSIMVFPIRLLRCNVFDIFLLSFSEALRVICFPGHTKTHGTEHNLSKTDYFCSYNHNTYTKVYVRSDNCCQILMSASLK